MSKKGSAPEVSAYIACDLCGRTTILEQHGRYRVYADHQNASNEQCTHTGVIPCSPPCTDVLRDTVAAEHIVVVSGRSVATVASYAEGVAYLRHHNVTGLIVPA